MKPQGPIGIVFKFAGSSIGPRGQMNLAVPKSLGETHRTQRGSCGWMRAPLAAAALVIALLAASRSHAACGYYVVAQNPSESMAANADLMRSHLASPANPHDCPCNGPSCRSHDSSTPAMPPIQSGGSDQQFACLFAAADLVEQPFTLLIPLPQLSGPRVYPSSVDPPPRGR